MIPEGQNDESEEIIISRQWHGIYVCAHKYIHNENES
jgi:hypothetical protein